MRIQATAGRVFRPSLSALSQPQVLESFLNSGHLPAEVVNAQGEELAHHDELGSVVFSLLGRPAMLKENAGVNPEVRERMRRLIGPANLKVLAEMARVIAAHPEAQSLLSRITRSEAGMARDAFSSDLLGRLGAIEGFFDGLRIAGQGESSPAVVVPERSGGGAARLPPANPASAPDRANSRIGFPVFLESRPAGTTFFGALIGALAVPGSVLAAAFAIGPVDHAQDALDMDLMAMLQQVSPWAGFAAFLIYQALTTTLKVLTAREIVKFLRLTNKHVLTFVYAAAVTGLHLVVGEMVLGPLFSYSANIFLSALGEEILFRRFLFGGLREKYGASKAGLWAAFIVSSLVFSARHIFAYGFVGRIFVSRVLGGLVFALLYHKGGLAPAVAAHTALNLLIEFCGVNEISLFGILYGISPAMGWPSLAFLAVLFYLLLRWTPRPLPVSRAVRRRAASGML